MSGERLPKLYAHSLSPFARRALYGLAFKGVTVEVVEVDLLHPSSEFLEASETKKVPTLTVFEGDHSFSLVESMIILEYIDTAFPGPPLYPRTLSGAVDAVKKARLDADCRNYIEAMIPSLASFIVGVPTEKQQADALAGLRKLNDDFLAEGQYFGHAVCGENVLTIADVALLPLVEYADALRDLAFGKMLDEFTNLWTWFERMSAEPWARRIYLGRRATKSHILAKREGVRPKLTQPLSLYL